MEARKTKGLYPPGTRKRNKTYIARFKVNGRLYEIDTKERDARAAAKIRKKLVALAQAEQDEALRASEAKMGRPHTFGEAATRYVQKLPPTSTQRGWVERIVERIDDLPLEDVSTDTALEVGRLLYPRRKPQTINRQVIGPMRAVLHYASEQGWCHYRPIKALREWEPEMRRPAPGVLELVVSNSEEPLRSLVIFLACQGWRISECLELTWDRVDLDAQTLKAWVPKVGKWKSLAMHRLVREALANRSPGVDPKVWPYRDRYAVYRALAKVTKPLGVTFTPHMARHEFGSYLAEQGATSIDLVNLSTWTSPRSSERYVNPRREHVQRFLDTIEVGKEVGKGRK